MELSLAFSFYYYYITLLYPCSFYLCRESCENDPQLWHLHLARLLPLHGPHQVLRATMQWWCPHLDFSALLLLQLQSLSHWGISVCLCWRFPMSETQCWYPINTIRISFVSMISDDAVYVTTSFGGIYSLCCRKEETNRTLTGKEYIFILFVCVRWEKQNKLQKWSSSLRHPNYFLRH